jgi:hypothetical protein
MSHSATAPRLPQAAALLSPPPIQRTFLYSSPLIIPFHTNVEVDDIR